MATNLRAKIPAEDTLIVHDVNEAATKRFQEEVGIAAKAAGAPGKGTGIQIATSLQDLAVRSVCYSMQHFRVASNSRDDFVLSMI